MLEQIIITSLFTSAVMFLLYKWNLDFWKCDYCMGFWTGFVSYTSFAVLNINFQSFGYAPFIALCASVPTFLIYSHIALKHDNHRFTGRY
jgi:hypothetical protein